MRVRAQSQTLPSTLIPEPVLPLAGVILLAAGCLARVCQNGLPHLPGIIGIGVVAGTAVAVVGGLALTRVVGRR